MSQSELTERDWKVIEYIKKNPGCSKQDVVRGMKGNPSRITVLNILDRLEYEGMIIPRKEKENSQIYQLFINNESLIIPKKQLLDDFKNSYLDLVNKSKEKIDPKADNTYLINSLLWLYEHFVGMCIFTTLFTWPQKINDKQDLNKLSTMAFNNLQEMQSKLIDLIPKGDKALAKDMTSFDVTFDNFLFYFIAKSFNEYGLYGEAEKVLDFIWTITFDFLSDDIVNKYIRHIQSRLEIKDLKNWRQIVEQISDKYERMTDKGLEKEILRLARMEKENPSKMKRQPLI
jgi:hypothetical protein